MTIHLPDDLEARLREKAAAEGVTVDEFAATELAKVLDAAPRRSLRGKGILNVGAGGPRARDLKPYMRGETGVA